LILKNPQNQTLTFFRYQKLINTNKNIDEKAPSVNYNNLCRHNLISIHIFINKHQQKKLIDIYRENKKNIIIEFKKSNCTAISHDKTNYYYCYFQKS